MPKDDPMEKISKLIEEKINAAFDGRAQAEKEEKDPWAKLEGIINRAIDKRFSELGEGLEEGKKKEKPDEKPEGILGIFGN